MNRFAICVVLFLVYAGNCQAAAVKSESVYKLKPNDQEAVYFTKEFFNIIADGKTDVSGALQYAINELKETRNFGILFIPEGSYLISKTIYVPPSIRLIGYGQNRPVFILGPKTNGFQGTDLSNGEKISPMFMFTGNVVTAEQPAEDANAGTFYCAFSNIDIKIEKGNPGAIALRTHFAQHGFVSHCNLYIGDGLAGIYDVGNEMEDVKFFGGEYGIYTSMTSPSWPMMMVDTYFEGQRKAAIYCMNAGLTIVNMHARNIPVVVEIGENYTDRLFMEKCLFENVEDAGIVISIENNSLNQVNLRDIYCTNVPVFTRFRISNTLTGVKENNYRVKDFTYGLVMADMAAGSEYKTIFNYESLKNCPKSLSKDIPPLPGMDTWVNIRELGAKGDGETDDTKIFQDAISKYDNIYVPQGWYRLTETLKLAPNTCLIGLHPYATQLLIKESTPAFSGFGSPVPLVQSSEGGNNIFSGIGINTGGYNYRATGMKWMAGEGSLLNDVKFVGGHGTMKKGPYEPYHYNHAMQISSPESPVTAQGKDLAWDNQYWSLWVTNNGGGTLKDIWTASTYAASGLFVNNTSTPARIYAISMEHHVRNEATFTNVSNWKIYDFQLEEETREGLDCQPVEMVNCRKMMFASFWIFRVIKINTPYPQGVRLWNCEEIEFLNVHNYAQVMHVTEYPVYDINKKLAVHPWEFAKLTVTGKEPAGIPISVEKGKVEKLATGFEFATGLTKDSRGNIYFCETRMRRIYQWSSETNSLSLIADFPWKPITLACDTKDNLLVVFRYDPQPGYMIEGKQEAVEMLPDDNPGFSGWGNSGWAAWAYSIDPGNPAETIKLLPKVKATDVKFIKKAIYPSSKWRYDFDRNIVSMPETSFMAPDQCTIIPETYDLGRSAALSEAWPGKPFYVSDESLKRIVKLNVGAEGSLSKIQNFVQRGEFSSVVDKDGNVYVADGKVYVYDSSGNETGIIEVEERPVSIVLGGKDDNTLFITTNSSLYSVRIR